MEKEAEKVEYECIYRPIKYRWKELYKPWLFTHNIQVLLAILSFSLFIFSIIIPHTLEWGQNTGTLSSLEWSGFIFSCIGAFIFIILSLMAFLFLIILAFFGWFGIKVPDEWKVSKEYIEATEQRRIKNN